MKIRNSFVSNSSSSSFIIAFDKGDVCEHCGRGENFLTRFSRDTCGGDVPTLYAKGKDEVLKELRGFVDETMIEVGQKVLNALKEGKEVAYVSVPYHYGDMVVDEKGVEILYDSNSGY